MAGETQQEERQKKKRFLELARQAEQTGRVLFSGFLGIGEQALLAEALSQEGVCSCTLWGGYEGAERQMARFGGAEWQAARLGGTPRWGGVPCAAGTERQAALVDGMDRQAARADGAACWDGVPCAGGAVDDAEAAFPIVCLRIAPKQKKFADDLTHRDFLGALMHLGVEREVIGDILVQEREGYVFVQEQMADFLAEEVTSIRHTPVTCARHAGTLPAAAAPKEKTVLVSSLRADSVVAAVYGLSRSRSLALFSENRVFVNGIQTRQGSAALKEGDRVTVRGSGRFVCLGVRGESRKGKYYAAVAVYG